MRRCKWCGRKMTEIEALCNDSICPDCDEIISNPFIAFRLSYPVWLCYCFIACVFARMKKSKGVREVVGAVSLALAIVIVAGVGIYLAIQILRGLLIFIFAVVAIVLAGV